MINWTGRLLLVVTLSGSLPIASFLSLYHFFQSVGVPSRGSEVPQLSSDECVRVSPNHVCGVCIFGKSMKSALLASERAGEPRYWSSTTLLDRHVGNYYTLKFFHVSRSPPRTA